jgi:uncharacterized membrane protein YhaH (DUF805 family)
MAENPERRGGLRGLLGLWFGFSRPVSRGAYLVTGLGLMAFKYAVEAAVVYLLVGRIWTPADYFSPSLRRYHELPSPVVAWGLGLWSLPFIWIGASMTTRRAVDAGRSAAWGLLFFVPVINDLVMLFLAALPTVFPAPPSVPEPGEGPRTRSGSALRGAFAGVVVGVLVVAANTAVSTLVVRSYSSFLFVGTPFVVGFVSAALFNADAPRTLRATLGLAAAAIAAAAGVVLLLALEGALCLAMAFPIALVLALVGAALGRAVALGGRPRAAPLAVLALALPALTGLGPAGPAPEGEVRSSIDVAAPPAVVWKHVIGFADLPPPSEWEFRHGVAYPMRARIEGAGVGAVRFCEFSTGAFVEPITVWDPPRRLGFDVRQEPPGMRELSPYDDVRAPHASGYLRSRRGEFRLIPLAGGGTRLEGTTHYTLEIFPTWYWSRYADAIIHRIHMRVLRHIKREAETEAEAAARGARRVNP